MYDSWTVNWFIIANLATVAMVVVAYFVYVARDKKRQSRGGS